MTKKIKSQYNYLLPDSSRRSIDKTVELVLKDNSLLDIMMDIALSDDKPVAQRASRVIFYSAGKDKTLVEPLNEKIILSLENLTNDSVKANFLSISSEWFLPDDEEMLGILADLCFKYLNGNSDREGLKICSMEILYKISQIYPEIKNELLMNIESLMQFNKSSFQSRGQKIINKLYQEQSKK